MKNIYKINYDSFYSSIEEVSPIDSWTGELIKFDDYEYFPTMAKAKKQLLQDLTNKVNNLKDGIKRIKNNY